MMQAPQFVETNLSFRSLTRRKETNRIVVHNSGTPTGNAKEFHRYHVEVMKWAGIAYHFVILPTGVIERGRPQEMVGGHCLHNNLDTIGICVVGNFDYQTPSPAQVDALTRLLGWLCWQYHMPVEHILGHRDLNSTSCPGKSLYAILPALRIHAATLLTGGTVPDAPPVPQEHGIIRLGDHGTEVADLQRELNQHDAAGLLADGVFGPLTLAAVCAYQREHDLDPDGIVGPLTWRALHGERTG
jgi:N-acetylmuramoyl-L-alanine amidase